jgi:hypothetical protein
VRMLVDGFSEQAALIGVRAMTMKHRADVLEVRFARASR